MLDYWLCLTPPLWTGIPQAVVAEFIPRKWPLKQQQRQLSESTRAAVPDEGQTDTKEAAVFGKNQVVLERSHNIQTGDRDIHQVIRQLRESNQKEAPKILT